MRQKRKRKKRTKRVSTRSTKDIVFKGLICLSLILNLLNFHRAVLEGLSRVPRVQKVCINLAIRGWLSHWFDLS